MKYIPAITVILSFFVLAIAVLGRQTTKGAVMQGGDQIGAVSVSGNKVIIESLDGKEVRMYQNGGNFIIK